MELVTETASHPDPDLSACLLSAQGNRWVSPEANETLGCRCWLCWALHPTSSHLSTLLTWLYAQCDSSLLPANIPVQHRLYHNASICKTQKLTATGTKVRCSILRKLVQHFMA